MRPGTNAADEAPPPTAACMGRSAVRFPCLFFLCRSAAPSSFARAHSGAKGHWHRSSDSHTRCLLLCAETREARARRPAVECKKMQSIARHASLPSERRRPAAAAAGGFSVGAGRSVACLRVADSVTRRFLRSPTTDRGLRSVKDTPTRALPHLQVAEVHRAEICKKKKKALHTTSHASDSTFATIERRA